MTYEVIFTARVSKQMMRAPEHITDKLLDWSRSVMLHGLPEVRRIKGYRDEPLVGKRIGERSIRLSRQWRAIYREHQDGSIFVYVLELTPHDYKK